MENTEMNAGTQSLEAEEVGATEKLLEAMRKQLRMMRVLVFFCMATLIVLAIAAVLVLPGLTRTIASANQSLDVLNNTVLPEISELNMDNLNDAIDELKVQVGQVDVDSLNSAVTQLQSAVKGIDIAALNGAIKNLDTTLKPLAEFIDTFANKN
jgi:NAD(P)-dependent dehydrogenase (short-subunit alcohol dehydrogenase family)